MALNILNILTVLAPLSLNILGPVSVLAEPLASHTISLQERYANTFVNEVFKDNILLTLRYMEGTVKTGDKISWDSVEWPLHYEFKLEPGDKFAFHDGILPDEADHVVKTTGAHFNYTDGFKSDGYLMGDGVCHLASLMYWVAKDAGLEAYAPKNHDFAIIPQISKEYGVAIYYNPGNTYASGFQNLYITNNKEKPVTFVFDYKDDNLTISVLQ